MSAFKSTEAKINEAMWAIGLNHRTLAAKAGMSRSFLSSILNRHSYGEKHRGRIARALGFEPGELFCEKKWFYLRNSRLAYAKPVLRRLVPFPVSFEEAV